MAERLKLAVNLSPVQFSLPNLAELVRAGTGRNRRWTRTVCAGNHGESVHLGHRENARDLHRLKTLGVRIAMDDFGTGYSSLSSLRSFPFDKIKIDRAFVFDLGRNSENSVIVQAVIIIASALGMTTVAEGVETADQQTVLTALGCDRSSGLSLQPRDADRSSADISSRRRNSPREAAKFRAHSRASARLQFSRRQAPPP